MFGFLLSILFMCSNRNWNKIKTKFVQVPNMITYVDEYWAQCSYSDKCKILLQTHPVCTLFYNFAILFLTVSHCVTVFLRVLHSGSLPRDSVQFVKKFEVLILDAQWKYIFSSSRKHTMNIYEKKSYQISLSLVYELTWNSVGSTANFILYSHFKNKNTINESY